MPCLLRKYKSADVLIVSGSELMTSKLRGKQEQKELLHFPGNLRNKNRARIFFSTGEFNP